MLARSEFDAHKIVLHHYNGRDYRRLSAEASQARIDALKEAAKFTGVHRFLASHLPPLEQNIERGKNAYQKNMGTPKK